MGSLVNGRDCSNHEEEDFGEEKEARQEEDKYKTQIEEEKITDKVKKKEKKNLICFFINAITCNNTLCLWQYTFIY